MHKKANLAQKRAEIAYRRKLVGDLYLAHTGQDDIARQLKCNQSTVSRDIKWLKKVWMRESIGEIGDCILQELAELNDMERQAALAFARENGKNPRWLLARLRIKEKKYMLLGLDKKIVELSGNIKVDAIEDVRAKRWESVEKSLAEIFFEQSGARILEAPCDDNGNE